MLLHLGGEEKKSPYGNLSKGFSPAVFIMTIVGSQNPAVLYIVMGFVKSLLSY